ncbi:P-loop containing nucleoside triphosphate hydrolase protein, partial [Martensiomyces pterosporus]
MFGQQQGPQPLKRLRQSSHDSKSVESPPRPAKRIRQEDDAGAFEIVDLIDEGISDIEELVDDATNNDHRQHNIPQQLQAADVAIKNRGDNTLAEETHHIDNQAMQTYLYPLLGGQPARAYQQGAIRRCLFQNTLVALPTGMGKTLIAVVVMANYARWFPDSLSVFLAPTKPLVAQQMQACKGMIHAILSRAWDSGQASRPPQFESNWIVEMNGSTPPKARQALWKDARFIFSTPQVLHNDLKSGTLDVANAKRISLLVIDEAHRATGKYAYGESVGIMYSIYHAAPFRVMALTATPGSEMDTVQEIINRLHISHIFLRTEESLDVSPYLHGRRIEEMVIALPPWLLAARDCLASVIKRSLNILCNVCHVMHNPGDATRISGFHIRMERDRFCQRQQGAGAGGLDAGRIMGEFTIAISLAHVMQLLSEHGLKPAWATIRSWNLEVARAKNRLGSATRAKIDCVDSQEWANMLRHIVSLAPPGFLGHPKLERLLEVVKAHFAQLTEPGGATSTRIIVFSQYRGSVSEIVGVLNQLRPQVVCEPFIGQGKAAGSHSGGSSSGNGADLRGQTQKEQLAVLGRFRQGTTNIIVATCVGEEGLDIGEVDLIINYDAPSSPIRLLQRIGRTGRARRGKVIVFLAKDTREENSYKTAQNKYKSMQKRIASGKG